jgi:hypothetical protein
VKRTLAGCVGIAIAGLAPLAAGTLAGAGALLATSAPAAAAQPVTSHPVILIGIAGLRWNDISRSATPEMWRLAATGSVGSLVTTTVHTVTCPADAWLTLNAGDRAAEPPAARLRCPPVPVAAASGKSTGSGQLTEPARIPSLNAIVSYNNSTGYQLQWGTLPAAAGAGRCATAIGPGAALALTDATGQVRRYVSALPSASQPGAAGQLLRQCPLTVLDLGQLPVSSARAAVLAADDRRIAAVTAVAPAGAIIAVAGMGDNNSPQLRTLIVSGPGYHDGLLTSDSTRQPGVVAITDLMPSIFQWRGQPVPSGLAGAAVTRSNRGPLAATITSMTGQNTANQVYRSIVGWFFLYYAIGEVVAFAVIAIVLRGSADAVKRRRVAWYSAAGAFGAAVPAGTFLANLVPWGQFAHPAIWLYGLGFGWAALIAVGAMIGPWRRDPYGPPGFVCAVTLAVIGIDVMTGSRLQIGAPFGLSLVEAGRFYGIGNNALGVYAVAAMLTTAWAAAVGSTARSRSRLAAVAAAGLVALAAVIAAGWPGFGAKVGGTIALVPAFLVLLAAIGEVRITVRRGIVIAVSGVVLVAAFAVLDYLVPAIGPSHQGLFVGQIVHGGAGGTLHRKISSNLHSLTETWFTPVIPVVAVVTGLMLAWPGRLRLRTFVFASGCDRLLRPALFAVWLAVVLGWLADDSGVSVAAAALPVALPLAIVLTVRTANLTATGRIADRRANLCAAGQ